ncbi:MAG: iron-sulfur cluster assembly accessory protein [Thermosynechococcus sp. Uc]|uniref:HesB/IscA family protein n=1 Tax=Thermosynechococcus sp. Uc TaxID=3034853 RepID=UPI00259F60F3|nr:iron-sulfur cluster assembly accessory protein [Thermosynechococcus sp. Uc]MDM7326520.1 iron-sulfur cluster assembly accessory protein [Thermosynechococcus sp. Uc]
MVELTPAALQELERLQAHGMNRGRTAILRIQVQPSECGDWRYDLALVAEPEPTDFLTESQGWTIAIAADAADLLRGLRVDYIEDLMGGAFRFHNPNASQTCGCGMAFRVSAS